MPAAKIVSKICGRSCGDAPIKDRRRRSLRRLRRRNGVDTADCFYNFKHRLPQFDSIFTSRWWFSCIEVVLKRAAISVFEEDVPGVTMREASIKSNEVLAMGARAPQMIEGFAFSSVERFGGISLGAERFQDIGVAWLRSISVCATHIQVTMYTLSDVLGLSKSSGDD